MSENRPQHYSLGEQTLQDRRLMGLTSAAFSLVHGSAPRRRTAQICSGLLGLMALPADIPSQPIHQILWDEHHFYSGCRAHIRKWKKELSAESLAAQART